MSTKSVNDLCSEIFEKSYSVRSLSNESICMGDDEALANELLHKMAAPVVSKLRRCFKKRRPSDSGRDSAMDLDRKVLEVMRKAAAEEGIEFAEDLSAQAPVPKHKTLWADEKLFVSSLEKIFGSHKYTTHAQKLFRLLDPFCTRRVWWTDLLDRLIQHGAKRHRGLDDWKPVEDDVSMEELGHCKKETIVKIVSISTNNTFCYVVVSKRGKVGTYDGRMRQLTEYDIFYARTGQQRRLKTTWITDAIYLSDTKSLVITASDRSLTIYDASTLAHYPLYLVTGIPNIPTCLTYEASEHKNGESRLYFGDDHGCVTVLQFKQPRLCLLYKKHTDRINDYFWIEMQSSPHDNYCSVTVWKKVHIRSVRCIFYCRRHDVVISCSNDANASIVIRHRPGKLDDYVFKVLRGVSCFHMSSSLRVLATGSADGCLRLWDPVLTVRPFAKMESVHRKPIVDVAVLAHMELVVTFSKNSIVDIWDIYEEVCVQTIKIRYPFIGVLGKRVEFGAYSLYPGPKRKNPSEEQSDLVVPRNVGSRCESIVFIGEDGGLKLESTEPAPMEHYRLESRAESDPEHSSWDKLEFLVTCCNYIAVLRFNPRPSEQAVVARDGVPSPLPPPDKMTKARRPSIWDNSDMDAASFSKRDLSPAQSRSEQIEDSRSSDTHLLTPYSTFVKAVEDPDLDTVLEQAGLNGILEKDFTLMMGLKHDLNKKLEQLKSKQESMKGPVSQCAPYIALDLHELEDIRFSQPLHISQRMKKKSGLQLFADPDNLLVNHSCFNMSSPRSSYSGTGSSRLSTAHSSGSTTPRSKRDSEEETRDKSNK